MRRCLLALALVLGGLAAGSAPAAGPVVLGEINPRTGLLAVRQMGSPGSRSRPSSEPSGWSSPR